MRPASIYPGRPRATHRIPVPLRLFRYFRRWADRPAFEAGSLVIVCALAGLAMTALVAWRQTARASVERSRAVDRAVEEYAAFAARMFGEQTFAAVGRAKLGILRPVLARAAAPGAPPLTLTEFEGTVRMDLRRSGAAHGPAIVGFFTMDRAGRVLATSGDPRTRAVASRLGATLSAPPPPEVADARFQYRSTGDPELGVGYVDLAAQSRGAPIYGFVFRSAPWRKAMGDAVRAQLPLLPASFVNPVGRTIDDLPGSDSLLVIDVEGPAGEYHSSRPFSSGVSGAFDARNSAGVRIVATLDSALVRRFRAELTPGVSAGPLRWLATAALWPLAALLLVLAIGIHVWRDQRMARARRAFVAAVSHEFRTPLSQMRMFTEMLQLSRAHDAVEARRWLEIVMREARRLESGVENILHFSHLDAGRARLEVERVDVGQVVEEVVEAWVPVAAARRMRLIADAPAGIIAFVDPRAVRRIVGNLLDNGLKFGPEGQVVCVGVSRVGDVVQLEVTDAGPGVPPDRRAAIWEAFGARGHGDASSGGTGIGLAVVRGLVRQHAGRVEVTGAEGGGARFVVTLPSHATGSDRTKSEPPAPGRRFRSAPGGALAVPALLGAIVVSSLATAWNLRSAEVARLRATDRAIGELASFGARLVVDAVNSQLDAMRLLALAAATDQDVDGGLRPLRVDQLATAAERELSLADIDAAHVSAGYFVFRRDGSSYTAAGAARDSATARAIRAGLGELLRDSTPAAVDRLTTILDGGTPLHAEYTLRSDSLVAGYIVARELAWAALARRALPMLPLFPPWLVDSTLRWKLDPVRVDTLFALSLTDEQGRPLYLSRAMFAGSPVGALAAGQGAERLLASASLHPELARRLRERLLAGLPRSPAFVLPMDEGRLEVPVWLLVALLSLQLAAAVGWSLRRQRTLARVRRDFVASVSHELRTPLAQIRMFTETMLLGRVQGDDERDRWLAVISRETRRLGDLLENILLFAQLDTDRSTIERERTDLGELAEEVVEGYVPLAERRGMRLLADAPSGIVSMVDPRTMRQVVVNLLDNALKYGPRGQVVRIELSRVGAVAMLAIEDEGEGIPEESRTRLFEPFVRLGRYAGTTGGSGIGLSVVRGIVELHGGRIRVESGATGGARFVVELPAMPEAHRVPGGAVRTG